MALDRLVVYKGKASMTGDATEEKFPGLPFEAGEAFDEILDGLTRSQAIAVLPLWNSHVGEITAAKILDYVFRNSLLIHLIWPYWVDFACIVKKGTKKEDIRKIISIGGVAEKQCSDFIGSIGAEFYGVSSTVDAHRQFSASDEWDAVLCNKKLCEPATQEVLIPNVANSLNFTTFVLLGKDRDEEWTGDGWTVLRDVALPKRYQLSCIEMPSIQGTLSEEQHELFDMFMEYGSQVNEIPKVIFASEREDGEKVGLVLEFDPAPDSKGFPDIDIMSDVKILNDVGSIKSLYAEEISGFMPERNLDFSRKHFVRHIGKDSCFYACPPLKIMVHGFKETVVESIIRQSIRGHFDAMTKGVERTDEQNNFFKKYKIDYYEKGIDFIIFEDV